MRTRMILLFFPVALGAQTPASPAQGTPVVFSRTAEVSLARSAAPAAVSTGARVYVLEGGHYVMAENGTSGMVCQVMRTRPLALEPECGDPEASETILVVDRFRVEQRIAGRSEAAIERAVADSILSGRFRLPRRPAIVYMMSSGQVLYGDNDKLVGPWKAHVMVYSPFLRGADLGLPAAGVDPTLPVVDQQGTAFANLIIVTHGFVDPVRQP